MFEKTKKCPYCAEKIQAEAIFCRYCKRDLPRFKNTNPTDNLINIDSQKKSSKQQSILLPAQKILWVKACSIVLAAAVFIYLINHSINQSKATETVAQTQTETPRPPTQTSRPLTSGALVYNPHPAPDDFYDVTGLPMRLVTVGEFIMGSDTSVYDQAPLHTVRLDAFYIDKYEVTNVLYSVCVYSGECAPPKEKRSISRLEYYGDEKYKNYPVIYVDWNMAKDYCEWRGSRLPTEAEWEKAARGTDGRIYPWGNDEPNSTLANYASNVPDTTEVGAYPNGASPYGVYDMAGNVWEWTADWYQADYYVTLGQNVTNPLGPASGETHVLRGGSWFNKGSDLGVSFRVKYYRGATNSNFGGFRCAREASP
jgi:eukaryotic-like serine/threonine-protein kinase